MSMICLNTCRHIKDMLILKKANFPMDIFKKDKCLLWLPSSMIQGM
jgi:hypothetical protein